MTDSSIWPEGYRRIHFTTIDSTNEEARRRAAAGEAGPLWITSDEQSAGRGRRGRSWVSPRGNLAATLLLRPKRSAEECAQLSFVAALGAVDAICALAPQIRFALKWPNDVLASGRKVAGILLESASNTSEPLSWVAIGIGINLAHHPEETEFPATSLAALGVDVSKEHAIAMLAASFAKWYETWNRRGFPDVRDAWLARAAGLGSRIRARLQSEETSGVFEGIDEHGALILRESEGRHRIIAAGDVFW